MRIIGADGQPDMVTLNQPQMTAEGIQKVLNDVTVGEYDVVMDTGPAFSTRRQQAVEAMMPLMAQNEVFKPLGTCSLGIWTFQAQIPLPTAWPP
jgi:hypothetical protein